MKLITLIFSFYILLLPGLPCMDKDECNEQEATAVVSNAGHAGHNEEEEACAPFCNCNCCGQVFSPTAPVVKISHGRHLPVKNNYAYYSSISLPSDYFGNIWQPPRLG